jgi:hypothetical protein
MSRKPGVDAQFSPPIERLPFPVLDARERDLPELWPEPLPVVVHALMTLPTVEAVAAQWPDIELR